MLQGLEHRLERMVEGVFARAFRSSLRPIELGKRMVREMDDARTVDVRGRVVVPNVFEFHLSPSDHDNFAEIGDALQRELCDAAREYARDEDYAFMGAVQVSLDRDPSLKTGRFTVASRFSEPEGGGAIGSLVLPSGERHALASATVRIGRLPEVEITLADPNVSRVHAEVRPAGTGYVLVDLQSTNGTKVNGKPVTTHELRDGDEISIGTARLRFEAS
jgi:hypothetical protein